MAQHWLGAHESIAGGLDKAFDRAQSVGCDSLQIFVKPNRNWALKELTDEDTALFQAKQKETGIEPVVAHASYLLNLATPDQPLWTRSRDMLITELTRCEALGIPFLVLHPGSHVGSGEEKGMAKVAQALGEVHSATAGFAVQVLLETTAGQGTGLGRSFEQLAWLMEHASQGDRLGACLDTCHVLAAGYELRTQDGYGETIDSFDSLIGLERLRALHLNDCKGELGSHRDRHAHIGQGEIGLDGFRFLLHDERLQGRPGLLETPKGKDLAEDRENLATLRSLVD
ncbi:MAG: deoxyribonuclease IV [Anaerolineales bacterium]|nr:MAG: deoxyribonuclease IV [Anaerolineales bacterium]